MDPRKLAMGKNHHTFLVQKPSEPGLGSAPTFGPANGGSRRSPKQRQSIPQSPESTQGSGRCQSQRAESKCRAGRVQLPWSYTTMNQSRAPRCFRWLGPPKVSSGGSVPPEHRWKAASQGGTSSAAQQSKTKRKGHALPDAMARRFVVAKNPLRNWWAWGLLNQNPYCMCIYIYMYIEYHDRCHHFHFHYHICS